VHRVLGIDPGSSATGWALIVADGNRRRLADSGVIRPSTRLDRPARLALLHSRVREIAAAMQPTCAAVETPFAGRNPSSSLTLAESRGAILAALGEAGLEVHSYSPAAVKAAIVGHGQAEKHQIVFMVTRLLGLTTSPAQDSADAMAVALTHIHQRRIPG
jgi:crossover junction endodeoxyribonuclease RuvC